MSLRLSTPNMKDFCLLHSERFVDSYFFHAYMLNVYCIGHWLRYRLFRVSVVMVVVGVFHCITEFKPKPTLVAGALAFLGL